MNEAPNVVKMRSNIVGATALKIDPELDDVSALNALFQEAAKVTEAKPVTKALVTGSSAPSKSERRAEAKLRGYEGDSCSECFNFTLVRNGTCMKCDTCGSTTGCS